MARHSSTVDVHPPDHPPRTDTTSTHTRAPEAVEHVNTASLEKLIGYNARRAALTVIGQLVQQLEPYGLQGPIDYSVLDLVAYNPGVTSRQLCNALNILPPNLVGIVRQLEQRGLVQKLEHPTDRRAQGLYLTEAGQALHAAAERTTEQVESDAAHRLTETERTILISMLRKIYLP